MKELTDKKQPEIRRLRRELQVDVAGESRKVEGYAILFEVESDGLPFVEVIDRGALDGVLQKSDVKALMNHDQRRGVLARRYPDGQGSLTLEVSTTGLRYSFDAPKTGLGDELLENLRRGEIRESSFAFTIAEEKWEKTGEDREGFPVWKRTILKFDEIYDVSPVYDAAYSETSVYLRGRPDYAEEGTKEEDRTKGVDTKDWTPGVTEDKTKPTHPERNAEAQKELQARFEVERYAALFSVQTGAGHFGI
jgi:HK97 family phage prohead protease